MSIFIMVTIVSFLEGLCEMIMIIKSKIELAIETRRFVRRMRNNRIGYRADYKTRMKYKIESIIDNIMTPN